MVSGNQYTLMIVDDEPSITRALQRLFRKEGYNIMTAHNGAEGLEKLKETNQAVSLIISDQRMPGMTGAQFLEQSRAIMPDAMRFLLTGYSDMDAVIQAVNNGGIHRYLNKPWNDDGLLLHVRQCLEHYALINENRRLTALTAEQNKILSDVNKELEQKVTERTREIQVKNKALLDINRMLENSIMDAVRLLASLVERLNPGLSIHLRETALLSRQTGQTMGLDAIALDKLEMAGMVHDIGLLGISDDLWMQDPRSLDKEQQLAFSEHPITTSIILENIEKLSEVGEIVLFHHEQVDGKGFPNGLHEDQIPIESRIVAAASEYCRITQKLPRDMKRLIKAARRYFDDDVWGHLTIEDDPEPVIVEIAEKMILMEANRRFDVNVLSALIKTIGSTMKLPDIITIPIEELETGMILMEDLKVTDGRLLLTKGTYLKEKLVDSIKNIAARGMTPERIAISMPVSGEEET